jgi:hypothetical protein
MLEFMVQASPDNAPGRIENGRISRGGTDVEEDEHVNSSRSLK